jgi:AraC family transcriptional regulator of adaptative response / DNA-3-methyladenine glycosylase II
VVQRALRVIAAQGAIQESEQDFAARFGVSARHLRRLFENEIGLTPKQISDGNRLDFARQLVLETQLPMTVVALNSGFSSLRRFNDAFRKRFTRTPSSLRRGRGPSPSAHEVILNLAYRPPFDWATLLDYYRRHFVPGLETIAAESYERVFKLEGATGVVRVQPHPTSAHLQVRVCCDDAKVLFPLAQKIRQMFDLGSDPLLVATTFEAHAQLNSLCRRFPGLRLPRAWDAYEGAVCTVLGQLVSVEQATRLTGQLVAAYGERIVHPISGAEAILFPEPEVLARASLSAVRTTGKRRESLRHLAQHFADGRLSRAGLEEGEEFRRILLAIPGIGPWSAEYAAVRSLGDSDAFPSTDLVLKRMIKAKELEVIRPWRAYAALYFWKANSLRKAEKNGSDL